MHHDAVSHHYGLVNLLRFGFGSQAGGVDQLVDGFDHQLLQYALIMILAVVDDPRYHIFAMVDLLVVFGHLRVHLPGEQIGQPDGHGGGADIHRAAPQRLVFREVDREQVEQARLCSFFFRDIQDGSHFPIAVPQDAADLLQQTE